MALALSHLRLRWEDFAAAGGAGIVTFLQQPCFCARASNDMTAWKAHGVFDSFAEPHGWVVILLTHHTLSVVGGELVLLDFRQLS